MAKAILAAVVLLACSCREEARLDPAGRMMLDPLRAESLRPDELVRRLALPDDATIADIGAGPGFLTLPLARAVPRGRVIATELDATYLAVIADRARAEHVDNVITRAVTANDPGLEPASIDVAILCQVDHFLADRAAYFRTLTAALRPNGRIVILNFNRYADGARTAAAAADLEVSDTWQPSGAFTAIVFRRR